MKRNHFIFLFFALIFFSCSFENDFFVPNDLSIVSWNVQTFFDSTKNGDEYYEFRSSKSPWNEQMYLKRLDNLCAIISKVKSDVLVMQEIENEKIIFDISNRFNNGFGKNNCLYKYFSFGKNEQSCIGIAILSKYEIRNVKFHNVDIKTESVEVPSMRPIVELEIVVGNKIVRLFANHWKSKSGGEIESEKWRKWQEKVLANIFQSKSDNEILVAAGDFNKDIREFDRNEFGEILFKDFSSEETKNVVVYSPWDDFEDKDLGTYYFDSSWEKIDHFFVMKKEFIKEFDVLSFEELTNDDGSPNKFELYKNKGYSDHLPIFCRINLTKAVNP